LRRWFARQTLGQLARRAGPLPDLGSDALVIAPHYDDEILGCGGLMALKLQMGARVGILWTTDGSRSHATFMNPLELAALRRSEGVAAARLLGIPDANLWHLETPERELNELDLLVVSQIQGVIEEFKPLQVFVPYLRDQHPDHIATTQLALKAITQANSRVQLYAYPVWFWYTWPWRPLAAPGNLLKGLYDCGLALRELKYSVDISSTLPQKRQALQAHRSQAERLAPDWPILSDVAGGEWLGVFFSGVELFQRIQ
jgi:LmbE family N-acetylglucosaminyl deacetylase